MSAPLQIAVLFAPDTPAEIRAQVERALSPILRRHGGELDIGEYAPTTMRMRRAGSGLWLYKVVSYATAVPEER